MRTSKAKSIKSKLVVVVSLAILALSGQIVQGCGSDDSGEPSCKERFEDGSKEFAACRFVEILNDLWREYENDRHTLSMEAARQAAAEQIFVGNSLYEEWFSTSYHTYEEVLSWFKNDVTVSNYNPQGARFAELTVKAQYQDTPGAKSTIPSIEAEVLLDNGKGFPILTMVEIQDHWYILALMHKF